MSAMHVCSDKDFEWIQRGVSELISCEDPNWKGNFVSHLLPPTFESYAKILHRITAKYENVDSPLSDPEIAVLRVPPCAELRSFVEAQRGKGEAPRIRWRTLAELLGVPYDSEICHEWFRARLNDPTCWPRFLYGPDEGNLDHEELSEVLFILHPFIGRQECFFRFASIPLAGSDKPILFAGALDGVVDFLNENKYQFSPEYLWPSDRKWCLCTDYDLMFTFVGGSRELISAILESRTLETLQVAQQTRIDSRVPLPNDR
jgi:hypothetical protein